MRAIEIEQGSEKWDLLRMTRPTASQFGRVITPKTGALSASHRDYACELVARQVGVYTEPPPSFWMEWGTTNEPLAIESYTAQTGNEVERVGFVLPDYTDTFGGSPDGLVANRKGLIEVKCPKPETLIRYHWDGELPDTYKCQVQGLLLITGCEWADFYAWHPEIAPFHVRVEPDEKFQGKMLKALEKFTEALESLRDRVGKSGLQIIEWGQ